MTRSHPTTSFVRRHPRGTVYIAVMGALVIVVSLVAGGLLAGRANARAIAAANDTADARQAALSGLELARLWIDQNAAWRGSRPQGRWTTDLGATRGTVSIDVVDPLDADFTNRPHDSVVVTVTGKSGRAVVILSQTLVASPPAAAGAGVRGTCRGADRGR